MSVRPSQGQDVTIPLEWANNIPGVSGIEDVGFNVPSVDDVAEIVIDNTLDQTQVDEAVVSALENVLGDVGGIADDVVDGVVDEIAETVDFVLRDLDLPTPDQLAEDLVFELTELSGFFGPLEEDFQRALQDVLGDPELVIDGLELPEIDFQPVIDGVLSGIEDLGIPTVDDLAEAVEDVLRDLEPVVNGEGLFEDPVGFITAVILEGIDRAVGDDTADNLAEAAERWS